MCCSHVVAVLPAPLKDCSLRLHCLTPMAMISRCTQTRTQPQTRVSAGLEERIPWIEALATEVDALASSVNELRASGNAHAKPRSTEMAARLLAAVKAVWVASYVSLLPLRYLLFISL